jgi:hypothetical protein
VARVSDLDDGAEVIDLATVDLPPVKRRTQHRRKVCPHRRTELDVQDRRVYCAGCGVELDPIEVLEMVSRAGNRFDRMRRDTKEGLERLNTILDDERKAKARLRSARAKLMEVESELKRRGA